MLSLTRVFQVNCDPECFYLMLMDQERYPDFLAEFKKIWVWKRQGEEICADCEARFFKTVKFTLCTIGEPFHQVKWREEKGIFQYNEGRWLLRPLGKHLTEVTYNISLDKGVLIPSPIVRLAIHWALPRLLNSFKYRAESLWREAPKAQKGRTPPFRDILT